jgi:hypothetical protein
MSPVRFRTYGVVILASVVAVGQAHAQQEGLSFQLMGGGVGTFQNLNAAGTEYFTGGPYLSGTLNWQPARLPGGEVRTTLAWTRHVLRTPRVGAGTKVNLFSLGIDVGYSYVNGLRFTSTLFGGAGAIMIHEGTTGATKVKVFSRLGIDADYLFAPRFEVFVQAAAIIYEISNFPTTSVLAQYHHGQGDGVVGGGLAVRF